MLAWPYLILHGWLPYRDIAIAHTPLLLLITTAWYKIVGLGLLQLQVLTWLIAAITTALTVVVTRSVKAGLLYLVLWAAFGGHALWFDLALAPLAVLLYAAAAHQHPSASGLWFGLMLLTKQTAAWFIAPVILVLPPRFLPRFLLIFGLVLVIFAVLLAVVGILDDFYVWAIKFGIFVLPRSPGQILLPTLRQLVLAGVPFLVFLSNRSNWRLLPWVVAGCLGIYPRWELWHLQPALPFLAIGLSRSRLGTAVVAGFSLLLIARTPSSPAIRFFEPEFIKLADSVRAQTSPGDRVFILNTWDHLYALTGTLPAVRPLIPHLSWYMDQPGTQEQIIAGLEAQPPSLVVIRDYDLSGLGAYRPSLIDSFITQHYRPSSRVGPYRLLIPYDTLAQSPARW